MRVATTLLESRYHHATNKSDLVCLDSDPQVLRSLIGVNLGLGEDIRSNRPIALGISTSGFVTTNMQSGAWHVYRVNLKQLDVKIEDPLHQCHRVANLLKRWLLGTYHGSASRKHLAAYLDEYAFRFNRRKTRGVGRIAARLIQQVVAVRPISYRTIVHSPVTP